jgi:hypothetical protein
MHLNSKVTIAIRCDDAKEAQLLGCVKQHFFLDCCPLVGLAEFWGPRLQK